MTPEIVSLPAALGNGADLWITAEDEAWCSRLDFYLNFQMAKLRSHPSRDLPDDVKHVLTENGIEIGPQLAQTESPVFVLSMDRLPCQIVAQVPHKENKSWVANCHAHWSALKKPSLRVFLPSQLSVADFKKFWPETSTDVPVGLVDSPPLPNKLGAHV